MLTNSLKALFNRTGFIVVAAMAVCAMTGMLLTQPAFAQHKANENDMEVPTNDMDVVSLGKAKYSSRCSFCHGSDGHGAKGPCLSCGKFSYIGNTNAEIYTTIAVGLSNRSLGGTMGAFGTSMTGEEMMAVLTFLRWEEKRRIDAGEIVDPAKDKSNEQVVFPTIN
jgi:mono/diheme cytochrome c family protein